MKRQIDLQEVIEHMAEKLKVEQLSNAYLNAMVTNLEKQIEELKKEEDSAE